MEVWGFEFTYIWYVQRKDEHDEKREIPSNKNSDWYEPMLLSPAAILVKKIQRNHEYGDHFEGKWSRIHRAKFLVSSEKPLQSNLWSKYATVIWKFGKTPTSFPALRNVHPTTDEALGTSILYGPCLRHSSHSRVKMSLLQERKRSKETTKETKGRNGHSESLCEEQWLRSRVSNLSRLNFPVGLKSHWPERNFDSIKWRMHGSRRLAAGLMWTTVPIHYIPTPKT